MKFKAFILGYFHDCQCYTDNNYDVENFSEPKGGILLLSTRDTQIWAYPDEDEVEKVEADWKELTYDDERNVHFESIEYDPKWLGSLPSSFQTRLEYTIQRYKNR